MKTTTATSLTTFGAALLLLAAFTTVNAASTNHVGKRILSKNEMIKLLRPKMRTRSIVIKQAQTEEEQSPASISMEIQFAFDSFELTSYARQQLKPLGEALRSNQLADFSFELEGHTDATGSEFYNQNLSEKRAASVKAYLAGHFGVESARLKTIGKGEYALLDPANPSSGVNRRVAITTMTNG